MIDTTMLGQLAGKHVKGPDGENIGKIADVYESTDGDRSRSNDSSARLSVVLTD